MSEISKIFLGWEKPFLWNVCEYLLNAPPLLNNEKSLVKSSKFDLRDILIVLPSKRAQRRILELLTLKAENEDEILIAPEVILSSDLSKLLKSEEDNTKKISSSESILIWKEVLNNRNELVKEFYSNKNSEVLFSNEVLSPLAKYLDSIRREIGENCINAQEIKKILENHHQTVNSNINFDGDINLGRSKWDIINELITTYNSLLKENSLSDPYLTNQEREFSNTNFNYKTIYLTACSNLSPLQKNILLQIKNASISQLEICSLIFTPEEHSEGFDEFGSLNFQYWEKHIPLSLPKNKIKIADSSLESINYIANFTKEINKIHPVDKLLGISLLESELISPLTHLLEKEGFNVISPGTKNLSNSLIGSWLILLTKIWAGKNDSLKDFLKSPLSIILIQKITLSRLNSDDSTINNLSDFKNLLPKDLDILFIETINYELENLDSLPSQSKLRLQLTKEALEELSIHKIKEENSLEFYCKKILEYLSLIYTTNDIYDNNPTSYKSLEFNLSTPEINEIISTLENLLSFSNYYRKKLSSQDFNALLKETLFLSELPPEKGSGIELLGWLELPLEDAPIKCISNLNEEYLPEKNTPDPLLPEQARRMLKLKTNESIYAQTIYNYSCIINSSLELLVLSSRKNLNAEHLKISRILVPEINNNSLEILNEFYNVNTDTSLNKNLKDKNKKETKTNNLPTPLLIKKPTDDNYSGNKFPLSHLSASAIKTYIRSPYEFYLRYILGVSDPDFNLKEIPPNILGTIIHNVANTILKNSSNISDVKTLLNKADDILKDELQRRFGSKLSINMQLQVDVLKRKLSLFCNWHLDSLNKGWTPLLSECALPDSSCIELSENLKIPFRGRIDRIDYLKSENKLRIIDIKTSDKPYTFKNCKKKEEWLDPQLPLYGVFLKNDISILPETYSDILKAQKNFHIELLFLNLSSEDNYNEDSILLDEEISESSINTAKEVARLIMNFSFNEIGNLSRNFHERLFSSGINSSEVEEDLT